MSKDDYTCCIIKNIKQNILNNYFAIFKKLNKQELFHRLALAVIITDNPTKDQEHKNQTILLGHGHAMALYATFKGKTE